ncbi:Rieske (2Fe-2S) protein [Streptomyces sp. NPDC088354]|uniref:Rieske (2Fe-2S) protein n=1 Tax=unclassified Streptomyces TaxID=2593676 RepID=UPI0029BB57F6|nr:Rieske (2Fe-2S) protein [Streptomyces sp. MI02-7b]MDX3076194.1 Rieske (2Fe-2S) protein [Streptomyces sp. MI02-7b]
MAETTGIAGTPTRRAVVAGVGAAGLAAALAACGDSNDSAGAYSPAAPPQSGAATGGQEDGNGAAQALAKTSDIPVGGGTVFADKKVVVCQPTAGQFKAFSAICTHQGCAVKDVANGTINCPCHGSKFNVADGSVAAGPATQPLPAADVTVQGDSITLA